MAAEEDRMSHLDEGTLNALLDGELDDAETRQIQAHLGRCTTCETRLDEVKSVRLEADQLVGNLETSSNVSAVIPPKIATAARRAALPPSGEAWPILLPDPLDSVVLRQQRLRKLVWAATILVVVGAGYLGWQGRYSQEFAPIVPTDAERSRFAFAPDSAVLGSEESVANPMAGSADSSLPPPAPAVQPPSNPSGTANPPRDASSAGGAESLAKASPEPLAASRDVPKQDAARPQAAAPSSDNELDEAAARRLRAAAATADVERAQRAELERRNKAEQARASAESQKPIAAPTTPPTLEQRADIYLRIGLDEASRQLGGPMHVIEGRSPMLVGLAPGRLSPGMDTTRPVVRAVYVDAANRLILLDQQRIRPGQTATAAPPLRTVIDNVLVQLHGEPAANVLRNLAGRIR